MTKSEDALACFRKGITCSSAVFSSFSEELGLDPETAKKIVLRFWCRNLKDGQYMRSGIRGDHGYRAEIREDERRR